MNDSPAQLQQQLGLRQAVLAVSVLEDVDLTPHRDGVLLDGLRPALVPWADVEEAIGPHAALGPVAHRRLSDCLRLHRLVADLGPMAPDVLSPAVRLLALPPDHSSHPGPGWVRARTMGGALDRGIGLLGVLDGLDDVTALPASVARVLGSGVLEWWRTAVSHADEMGSLCVSRLQRDHRSKPHPGICATQNQLVLRPVGGVDVPTLLTTPALRTYLASSDGSGMRAVAAPVRSRGWYDLARIDPAFVQAAWAATDEGNRGLRRPLLVTVDEVVLAPAGGNMVAASLADPVASSPFSRDVRYR